MINKLDNNEPINGIVLQKMKFILNALNKGWTIKKEKNEFIFTKPHEGKKEVFSDNYLLTFMEECFDKKINVG